MSFINLEGERETSHQRGEQYKDAVVEFLKASDFRVVKDSSVHGITPDLICKKPEAEGTREFHIEAKDTDLSRLADSFLRELARYFITYTQRPRDDRFDFYLFVRRAKATNKWRHIFDDSLRRDEAVEEYYQRLSEVDGLNEEEAEKLANTTLADFREFVADTDVYQGSYSTLMRQAEELCESGRLVSDFFLREPDPYNEPEELTTNFVKIDSLPDTVYIGPTTGVDDYSEVYNSNPHYLPIWLEGDNLMSLLPISQMPESLSRFIEEGEVSEASFRDWVEEGDGERRKTAIALLKRYVTKRAVERGCVSVKVSGEYRLLVEHDDLNQEVAERDDLQVSKVYYADDGSPRFVRHRAVTIDIGCYGGEYYLFLSPTHVYTEDGRTPIEGEQAKHIDDQFSGSFVRNDRIRRYVRQWSGLLGVGEFSPGPDQHGFDTTPVTGLELSVRPVEDTDEQEKIMSHRSLEDYS